MAALTRAGMEAGAHRAVVGPVLRARQLREDRGGHRARQGRGGIRRRVQQPHPGRGGLLHRRGRRRAGGDPHRRRGARHRRRLAHEGARSDAVGPVDRPDVADRAGAGARRAGVRGSVSVRGQRHGPVGRARSALGAGGRPPGVPEAAWRRGSRAHQERDCRQPEPARRRRYARRLELRAGTRARGQVSRRDRQGAMRSRPSISSSRCSSAATAGWCRSACPRPTSCTSCGSRGR